MPFGRRWSLRAIDLLVLLTPVIVGFVGFEPLAGWRAARDIHVARSGSDRHTGATSASAVSTLQRALDLAIPGDRIVIGPGTYYERVHVRRGGTLAAPVVIAAETPGTVVITGADPRGVPPEWSWHSEGQNIYSTVIHRPVYRLQHHDMTCFRIPWGGQATLRKYVEKGFPWSAFCTEKDRLYLFLKDGVHPAQAVLKTHRPAPAPREWGELKSATVWVEADHVRLEGLQIEDGLGAGVTIWNAEDIEIRDCAFSGATFGVRCADGPKPARDVRMVNCLYHNYPQYHWRREWLTWDEVYAAYSSSTLIASTAAPLTIENCLVTHAGDALRISPATGQGSSIARVERNYLAFCTDDAIEFDGDAAGVNVAQNLVFEAHQNLAFSPVKHGPVDVRENLFVHLPDGINGSQIKFINNQPGDPIRNIDIHDNVFIGDWLCWRNDAPIENVAIGRNQFFVRRMAEPPWPPKGVTVAEGQVELQRESISPVQHLSKLAQNPGTPAWLSSVISRAPGPSWWPGSEHPATKDALLWRQQMQQSLQRTAAVEHN